MNTSAMSGARPRYKRKFGGFVLPKWNDAQTVKFFALYEKHRCLWDLKDQDYRNMEARAGAYQDILLEMKMDCSEDILKKKIKNIRTIYARELKEVKRTRRAGCPDPVYVPTLSWYHEADRFLRHIVSERASKYDGEESQQECHNLEDAMDDGHGDCIPADLLEGELIEEDEIETYETPMRHPHAHPHHQAPRGSPNQGGSGGSGGGGGGGGGGGHGQWRPQKRAKFHPRHHNRGGPNKVTRTSNTSTASVAAQRAISRLANLSNHHETAEDEFATFGKLVSSQLRSMPFDKAIVAQSKILTLLTEERVQWLAEVAEVEQEKHVGTIVHIDGDGHEYAMEVHQEDHEDPEDQEQEHHLQEQHEHHVIEEVQ